MLQGGSRWLLRKSRIPLSASLSTYVPQNLGPSDLLPIFYYVSAPLLRHAKAPPPHMPRVNISPFLYDFSSSFPTPVEQETPSIFENLQELSVEELEEYFEDKFPGCNAEDGRVHPSPIVTHIDNDYLVRLVEELPRDNDGRVPISEVRRLLNRMPLPPRIVDELWNDMEYNFWVAVRETYPFLWQSDKVDPELVVANPLLRPHLVASVDSLPRDDNGLVRRDEVVALLRGDNTVVREIVEKAKSSPPTNNDCFYLPEKLFCLADLAADFADVPNKDADFVPLAELHNRFPHHIEWERISIRNEKGDVCARQVLRVLMTLYPPSGDDAFKSLPRKGKLRLPRTQAPWEKPGYNLVCRDRIDLRAISSEFPDAVCRDRLLQLPRDVEGRVSYPQVVDILEEMYPKQLEELWTMMTSAGQFDETVEYVERKRGQPLYPDRQGAFDEHMRVFREEITKSLADAGASEFGKPTDSDCGEDTCDVPIRMTVRFLQEAGDIAEDEAFSHRVLVEVDPTTIPISEAARQLMVEISGDTYCRRGPVIESRRVVTAANTHLYSSPSESGVSSGRRKRVRRAGNPTIRLESTKYTNRYQNVEHALWMLNRLIAECQLAVGEISAVPEDLVDWVPSTPHDFTIVSDAHLMTAPYPDSDGEDAEVQADVDFDFDFEMGGVGGKIRAGLKDGGSGGGDGDRDGGSDGSGDADGPRRRHKQKKGSGGSAKSGRMAPADVVDDGDGDDDIDGDIGGDGEDDSRREGAEASSESSAGAKKGKKQKRGGKDIPGRQESERNGDGEETPALSEEDVLSIRDRQRNRGKS